MSKGEKISKREKIGEREEFSEREEISGREQTRKWKTEKESKANPKRELAESGDFKGLRGPKGVEGKGTRRFLGSGRN